MAEIQERNKMGNNITVGYNERLNAGNIDWMTMVKNY